MDAWHELEMITPLNRAQTEVLTVRLAVCRALKDWDLAENIARTLIKREPENIMHVVALAEVMGHREGPVAAAAVYEFAVERTTTLRISEWFPQARKSKGNALAPHLRVAWSD
jgi:hypothetical protein